MIRKIAVITACLLVCVFCAFAYIAISNAKLTAYDCLVSYEKDQGFPFKAARLVADEALAEDRRILFYYNTSGSLCFAIMRKTLTSYAVDGLGGELIANSGADNSIFNYIGGCDIWVYWGTTNEKITRVYTADADAKLVRVDDTTTLYYFAGNGPMYSLEAFDTIEFQ